MRFKEKYDCPDCMILGNVAHKIDHLNPHDALKHHFESLKNGLISYT